MHYWITKWLKYIFKKHLQRYPYVGCKLCTHRCECVGTKNTSFTEEQVSWNLCIGPLDLEKILNFVNVFLLFRYYLSPRMLCAKFG